MSHVTITPQNDGPYHVQGAFKIVTEGGRTIAVDGDETWLCRCGQSAKKAILRWHAHADRLQEQPGRIVTGVAPVGVARLDATGWFARPDRLIGAPCERGAPPCGPPS